MIDDDLYPYIDIQTICNRPKLLSRTTFRESVFERDQNRCVVCGSPGQDAHHILERRLFPDGGYYIENGATLCGTCHLRAESTELTCEKIRSCAGISRIILPPHLYEDIRYDKWGNPYLANGQRLKGELFFDESVQKILWGKDQFTTYVKYPRTYHLPNSNPSKDDRTIKNLDNFRINRVIVTEKMDGENTTMYRDHIHARSVDSDNHPSRSWVKQFHAENVAYQLDEGWRICGENLFAKHAIGYNNLESYFLGFSMWDDKNNCLSWDDTLENFEILGIKPVKVLYDGYWYEDIITDYIPKNLDKSEGFVVRMAKSFHYSQFKNSVAKWVRPNHVQTTHNWKRELLVKNGII